jgi:hypothetical protein
MIEFNNQRKEDFAVVADFSAADILISNQEDFAVQRAARDLRDDFKRLGAKSPKIYNQASQLQKERVIIITSAAEANNFDFLNRSDKEKITQLKGKWESFIIKNIDLRLLSSRPEAIIIAGSDIRGTIYGIYELTREMGVSPWYWWADVFVEKRKNIYFKNGEYSSGEPSVKYRGIFLNDEAPSLTSWVENKFNGFNHNFYEKVFELLLRLKANYLWPAMWKPRIFNEEDCLNPLLADKYGVVMGTSHHEPMLRSWEEWSAIGSGAWDYNQNRENIYRFWEESIKRNKGYQSIYTLGMRGDGDEAMSGESSFAERKKTLKKVIADQRNILAENINQKLESIPQLLALYKEVQSFYEAGMEIPEDITLLLADDNFGNLRMLPQGKEKDREGGYGIYYHFDYVGGPRSYQWINTVPIEKIWEQMTRAYKHQVDEIWITNVGDLKPMEVPISFFLDLAWNVNDFNENNLKKYLKNWCQDQFGSDYADSAAEIISYYTKHNGRRKPELVVENTYSLINYREAKRLLTEFKEVIEKSEKIYKKIEEEKRDSFFQLVLYPARASFNIFKMHYYASKNKFYAEQNRAATNDYADLTAQTFAVEAQDTEYYNKQLAGGKWNGLMLQPHIGKSNWRGPKENRMPEVRKIELKDKAEAAVVCECEAKVFKDGETGKLTGFNKFKESKRYFEIFNQGANGFDFKIESDAEWILLSKSEGRIEKEERIFVEIFWNKVTNKRKLEADLKITAADSKINVEVKAFNPPSKLLSELSQMTFVENNGYISIEAEHFSRKNEKSSAEWVKVPDYGRTLSSMMIKPMNTKSITKVDKSPYLEYSFYNFTKGEVEITVYTAPSLNVDRRRGVRYAISLDKKQPKIVDIFPIKHDASHQDQYWADGVKNNIRLTKSHFEVEQSCEHKLRIYMVDPEIIVQKIVIDFGGVKECYLGPPESFYIE